MDRDGVFQVLKLLEFINRTYFRKLVRKYIVIGQDPNKLINRQYVRKVHRHNSSVLTQLFPV